MPLRGEVLKAEDKRFKAVFYGGAGVGKTTAAIQFPKPYVIYTEDGINHDSYRKLLEKSGGVVYKTQMFEDVLQEVTSLISEKHDYKTLVIDSISVLHTNTVEQSANSLKTSTNPDGTAYNRHHTLTSKKMNRLFNLISRLDMNVIITSHAKDLYSYGTMSSKIGVTFDCYKKIDYFFDLLFYVTRQNATTTIATVEKSRITEFQLYKDYEFSFENIAKIYGVENFERDAKPIDLATKEQVMQLRTLVNNHMVKTEIIDKWLLKAKCDDFSEMDTETIEKCIEYVHKKGAEKSEKEVVNEDINM